MDHGIEERGKGTTKYYGCDRMLWQRGLMKKASTKSYCRNFLMHTLAVLSHSRPRFAYYIVDHYGRARSCRGKSPLVLNIRHCLFYVGCCKYQSTANVRVYWYGRVYAGVPSVMLGPIYRCARIPVLEVSWLHLLRYCRRTRRNIPN